MLIIFQFNGSSGWARPSYHIPLPVVYLFLAVAIFILVTILGYLAIAASIRLLSYAIIRASNRSIDLVLDHPEGITIEAEIQVREELLSERYTPEQVEHILHEFRDEGNRKIVSKWQAAMDKISLAAGFTAGMTAVAVFYCTAYNSHTLFSCRMIAPGAVVCFILLILMGRWGGKGIKK